MPAWIVQQQTVEAPDAGGDTIEFILDLRLIFTRSDVAESPVVGQIAKEGGELVADPEKYAYWAGLVAAAAKYAIINTDAEDEEFEIRIEEPVPPELNPGLWTEESVWNIDRQYEEVIAEARHIVNGEAGENPA